MNPPENNDPLDALLREQNPHIADEGFTRRVIAALPPRRSRFPLRQAFLLGATLAGWVLAVLLLPWGKLPPLNSSALLSLNWQVLWPWAVMLTVAGSLIWALIDDIQSEDY
jgi:hypothetical protein